MELFEEGATHEAVQRIKYDLYVLSAGQKSP